jgi:NAD(P)-dependent dehydrogenase (short-subunit alcohol dehydrogenase family)
MTSDSNHPVAVVSHASEPVQGAVAARLLSDGYRVVACVHEGEDNAVAVAGPVTGFSGDLSDRGAAERLVEFTLDRFGRVDVLVATPLPFQAHSYGPVSGLLQSGMRLLQPWTNLVEAFAPALTSPNGRIISVVKNTGRYRSGYFRLDTEASEAPQALAHGAVLSLTRQLALEFASRRIRVNAVVTGLIEESIELSKLDAVSRQYLIEEVSLGRFGQAEEVASVVSFLASAASNYVTGDAIDVNGGWWMS